jgi:hypothetical protein
MKKFMFGLIVVLSLVLLSSSSMAALRGLTAGSPVIDVGERVITITLPEMGNLVNGPAAGGIARGMIILSILKFIGFLILAIILTAFFSNQLKAVSANVEKNMLQTFLYGLLVIILFVPVIILLTISLAGIPLIPVWVILVAVAGVFGYTAAAGVVGRKVLKTIKLNKRTLLIEILVGITILFLLGLLPILGAIVKMVVLLWGIGAVALTRFGTQKA